MPRWASEFFVEDTLMAIGMSTEQAEKYIGKFEEWVKSKVKVYFF